MVIADKPEDEGFKVWDTKTLAIYIKRKYGVEYSQSTTSRLLHKLGFNLIRPTTYPSLETQQGGPRGVYKKLAEKLVNPTRKLAVQDEDPIFCRQLSHENGARKGGPKEMSKLERRALHTVAMRFLRRANYGRQGLVVHLRDGDPIVPRLDRQHAAT